MTTAENIRAAALGPPLMWSNAISAWLGEETAEFNCAINIIDRPHHFWLADETTQRAFLLLVAEELELSWMP